MRLRTVVLPMLLAGAALAVLGAGCAPAPATPMPATEAPAPTAAPAPTEAPPLTGSAARGGQLYDKWWSVLGVDAPEGDQPLWSTQTTNARTGADTWRCKECHGWDYKGADGAYGSGSHATGFPGVMSMAGMEPQEALDALRGSTNPDHDFSQVMDDQALADLAFFLTQGLMDTSSIVGADKSLVTGEATAGAANYAPCVACHGAEGTAINFGDDSDPEYVGTIGAGNPWEFLHKVRFGQPGVPGMPAAFALGVADSYYADLLAYSAALPASSPVAEGGRLYDKWWTAIGADMPEGDQPLWASQSTNERTGGDTWRCKECHGWDYKGADGAYGSGSHFTGFKGIAGASSLSAEQLIAWLSGGVDPDHDFSEYLAEPQMNMLVAFIQSGTWDVSPVIDADKMVSGDAQRGQALYGGVCVQCHGADGKALNFGDESEPEYVGTIALDNPWEAIHKIASGQPGTPMPAGRNFGWTLQDIADLVAYLQTLPAK